MIAKLRWIKNTNVAEAQASVEQHVLRVLGLASGSSDESNVAPPVLSSHALDQATDITWPLENDWSRWDLERPENADRSKRLGDANKLHQLAAPPDAIHVGIVWRTADTDEPARPTGFIPVRGLQLFPRHSPLLPTLLALLDTDKASVRAMYEETSKHKQRLLTEALTGELAVEQCPLVIQGRFDGGPTTDSKPAR